MLYFQFSIVKFLVVPISSDGGTAMMMRAAGRCEGHAARTTDKTVTRLSVVRVARPVVELPPKTQLLPC